VAATENLHIGNLYNMIIADTIKKAHIYFGKKILFPQSWNCHSQKLEDKLTETTSNKQDLTKACRDSNREAISKAQNIFDNYSIDFDDITISDIDENFMDYVRMRISKMVKKSSVYPENTMINNLPLNQVLSKFADINWIPSSSQKLLKSLKAFEKASIGLFRKSGVHGVKYNGNLVGQRIVQSFVPDFCREVKDLNTDYCVLGNDILGKWCYMTLVNSQQKPFNNLILHGLMLNKENKKISKYDDCVSNVYDLDFDEDSLRLYFLRQRVGRDFKYPTSLNEEIKLKRKVFNSMKFLKGYLEHSSQDSKGNLDFSSLENKMKKCVGSLSRLKFNSSYVMFRDIFYNNVSRELIPTIKKTEVNRESLFCLVSKLDKFAKVFVPNYLN
jgi:valyl-tRNA synthetase